jgi:hypothetical protein
MDTTQVKITKAGKPLVGDPQAGRYYKIAVPEGVDAHETAKELKKQFPKSFFVYRIAVKKPMNAAPVQAARKSN